MQTSPNTPPRPLDTYRRAIVVGASSGLGAALVRELATNGYAVAALARRTDELTTVCDPFPHAYAFTHDVTDSAGVPDAFHRAVSALGGLDLIIYVAGIQPTVAPDEYDFEKDATMMAVNALGAMAWFNIAALRFDRAGAGHIVGVSSISGDRGRAAFPGYHTSKAALSTFLESLRNRLARRGVTVTTIKPGFMQTRLLENADKTFWVVSPEEAARQVRAAIEAKKQVVYIPGRWRFVSLIIQHIPSFIFRRIGL